MRWRGRGLGGLLDKGRCIIPGVAGPRAGCFGRAGRAASGALSLPNCAARADNSGMRWFGRRNHEIIEVRFFDTGGELLWQSKMPIAQLPQSFEADTTLSMKGQD